MNKPELVWENAFMKQSDRYIRSIIKLVVFNGGKITETKLISAYEQYWCSFPKDHLHEFNQLIRVATESFLNRSIIRGIVYYEVFNPSINDYVLSEYCKNESVLYKCYTALISLNSFKRFQMLKSRALISKNTYQNVISKIVSSSTFNNSSLDCQIFTCDSLPESAEKLKLFNRCHQAVIKDSNQITVIEEYLGGVEKLETDLNLDYLIEVADINSYNYDSAQTLDRLLESQNEISSELTEYLGDIVTSLAKEHILDDVNDLDLDEYVFQEHDGDYSFDTTGLESVTDDLIQNYVTHFKSIGLENLDSDEIKYDMDFQVILEAYQADRDRSGGYENRSSEKSSISEIHDLFQKT